MGGRVVKSRTSSPRAKLSNTCQKKLLNAALNQDTGHAQDCREQSADISDLAPTATPARSRKRRLDASEADLLPAKRARPSRTNTPQSSVEDEEAERPPETTLQQPKPTSSKRSHASFLEDLVSPTHSNPQTEPVNDLVSGWLESDFGSDRKKHSRSDSYLRRSDDGPVPRKLTKSAPDMSFTRDSDGFAVPPTPPRTRSFPDGSQADSQADSFYQSDISGSGRSGRSGKKLVEEPLYRSRNLAANNIYMRYPYEEFPERIAGLVDIARKERVSPDPPPDQLRQDHDLLDLELGGGEPEIEQHFRANVFPYPKSTESIKRSDKQWITKHAIPNTGSLRLSTPIPDMLYGYNSEAFRQQQAQLISMGTEMVANNQGLIYPFFAIEFKGDGPAGVGSMWVATNQCLGASTSCVKIAERLNRQLRECKSVMVQPVDSAAFSVAMNGTEARLYISWKHNDLDYYVQKVKSFLLQEPEHYLEFRKYVRNIIDWGKDKRLKEIRASLDSLLEESRQRASKAAKARRPPSDHTASSTGGKRRAPRKTKPQTDPKSVSSWEWDEEAESHKYWDKDMAMWIFWDQENEAEKYWTGREWKWV